MKLIKYIFFIIIFAISNTFANNSEKIVFLDIDYILNNSTLGKSIYTELNKINKQNLDNLNKIEKSLNNKKESIDKTRNISTKEKLEKDVNLFNQEVSKYISEKKKILENFKSIKKKKLDNFLTKINPIVEEYMKNNSIDIILEKNQIFMGNINIDITNDIILLVNKNFSDDG